MFVSKIRADGGSDRSPWGDFWFTPVGSRSLTGQRVSPDGAMRLSSVYACVRVASETMAMLPFRLYRNKQGGGKKIVTDHWLYQLMAKKPNRWQNAFEWREMMQSHLELRGNAYNEIVANSRGDITELQPIHPDCIKIEMLDGGNWRYVVKGDNGQERRLPPGMVFKLSGLSSNGILGLSPIDLARDAVGLGLSAQEFGARFFANDARPLGGWIEFPGRFKTKEDMQQFRANWQASQAGNNRGKTAVLQDGMKFHEIGINNRDSQFLELRNFQLQDIARFWRIPPHLIGDLSRATFSNIEHQSLDFVIYSITPRTERWEAAIEDQLLTEEDDLEVEFDMGGLLRGDHASRAEYYQSGINAGWLTRNEARIGENLDPIDGLDEPLQPLNMVAAGEEPAADMPESDPEPRQAPDQSGEGGEQEASTTQRLQALVESNANRIARRALKEPLPWSLDFRGLIAEAMALPLAAVTDWAENAALESKRGREWTESELAASLRALGAVK